MCDKFQSKIKHKEFAIIDIEGCTLKTSNDKQTFIATEVSGVIIQNLQIRGGFSYRINFDIRNIEQFNKHTLKYLKYKYPNTFRNRLVYNSHTSLAPQKCREMINNMKTSDGQPMPLYAKGCRAESIWMHYPTSCDGLSDPLPKNIIKIGEIEDIVDKYDKIKNKHQIIQQHIHKISKHNISDKFILNIQNVHHHYSLYECIVFAHQVIEACIV